MQAHRNDDEWENIAKAQRDRNLQIEMAKKLDKKRQKEHLKEFLQN